MKPPGGIEFAKCEVDFAVTSQSRPTGQQI